MHFHAPLLQHRCIECVSKCVTKTNYLLKNESLVIRRQTSSVFNHSVSVSAEVPLVLFLFLLISLVWLWAGLHMAYKDLWMLVLFVIFNCLLVSPMTGFIELLPSHAFSFPTSRLAVLHFTSLKFID